MTRSEFKRIQDILECADDLAELAAMGKVEFYGNKFWALAGARLLENIGEASTHLTDEILESLPEIEWKKIVYFDIL